jgi:hypothetical protein
VMMALIRYAGSVCNCCPFRKVHETRVTND